jgi:hypothetical protein
MDKSRYGDWLQAGSPMIRSSSLLKIKNFYLHIVQTGSRARPNSYPMSMGGALSSGLKRPGRNADYSPAKIAEVKETRIYTSFPP